MMDTKLIPGAVIIAYITKKSGSGSKVSKPRGKDIAVTPHLPQQPSNDLALKPQTILLAYP
ncbi:hypothetical protein E2C01_026102 [Portunus trituberculatus]|uniref:Uncharacterized protein n=1 Tax=Portunus trituberculatus TaxID=210409 RepID=A0A5B7EHA2_PORTR|nr:hypothetical protein [Portunus trituberculatus]